jgi:hypothetical protein
MLSIKTGFALKRGEDLREVEGLYVNGYFPMSIFN